MSKIDVYWSYLEPLKSQDNNWPVYGFLEAEHPQPLLKNIPDNIKSSTYSLCPASRDYMSNTFIIRSPIDISFDYDIPFNSIGSNVYNEFFWNKTIIDTSLKYQLLQVIFPFVFFSNSSVIVSQLSPYLHKNNSLLKYGSILPGEYDISKWFRNYSLGLDLYEPKNSLNIKKGDILYYLKFNTKQKINFHKFYPNQELYDIYDLILGMIKNKQKTKVNSLLYNYNIFKRNNLNKKILKNIKQNLV